MLFAQRKGGFSARLCPGSGMLFVWCDFREGGGLGKDGAGPVHGVTSPA
jgi:hypothetical protein